MYHITLITCTFTGVKSCLPLCLENNPDSQALSNLTANLISHNSFLLTVSQSSKCSCSSQTCHSVREWTPLEICALILPEAASFSPLILVYIVPSFL